MKKTILTLTLVLAASVAGFAQGKVKVVNDGGSPYTLGDVNHVLAADSGVAGLAVATTGPLPSGKILSVGLYWGTTASSATLALAVNGPTAGPGANPSSLNPVSGGSGVPGVQNQQSIAVSGATAGAIFLQLRVWDSAFASYEAALIAHPTGDDYFGVNNVWQMTPGFSITYTDMKSGGGSTWASVGNENPLIVSAVVPEPSSMALAGLGAAAMLIFRRRNK